MSDLPFIDEHSRVVNANPQAVWEALTSSVPRSFSDRGAESIASLLGCRETQRAGRDGEPGSTFPGFRVARAAPGKELALAGEHRFSRYELNFRIEDLGGGRSRLAAETRARFPGLKGRAYRTLVIGTRGHVLATRRLLAATARRAEHPRARQPEASG